MRLILLFWLLGVVACNNSSENFNIAAIETLVPKDSNAMYIPIKKPDDSSFAMASSYFLFKFHEPMLSHYTGKTDVYRFTWVRTFHEPMIFRIQRLKDTVQFITKILEGKGGYGVGKIIHDTSVNLSTKEWGNFISLVNKAGFWTISNTDDFYGFDGATWLLEGVQGRKYHWADRWSGGAITKPCEYLISLSPFKIDPKNIY